MGIAITDNNISTDGGIVTKFSQMKQLTYSTI